MYTTEDIINANKQGITSVYALWNSMKHIFDRTNDKEMTISIEIEEKILLGDQEIKLPIEYLFPEYTINYKRKTGVRLIPGISVGDHKYFEEQRKRTALMNKDLMLHIPDKSRTMSYSDKKQMRNSL